MLMPMKNFTMKNDKVIVIGIIMLGLVITLSGCATIKEIQTILSSPTPIPFITHGYEMVGNAEYLWENKKVFVSYNGGGANTLDAAQGITCFLGGFDKAVSFGNMDCINSKTGDFLWKNASGRSLVITSQGVFVSFTHPGGIRKYDLATGDLIWGKTLGGNGANDLYYVDGQIQVSTVPDNFWILDTDGNVINKFPGDYYLITTAKETFINRNKLQDYITGTNNLLWEYGPADIGLTPLFTQNIILLRSGDLEGEAYAIDRKTGKFLWVIKHIVSNIVYSPEKQLAYALSEDGKLVAIDEDSGEAHVLVQFTSVPFIVGGRGSFVYQLAYDPSEHVIVAQLGDSYQLFAFKEK
jgi:outer membrane protein assembly factor BamB